MTLPVVIAVGSPPTAASIVWAKAPRVSTGAMSPLATAVAHLIIASTVLVP